MHTLFFKEIYIQREISKSLAWMPSEERGVRGKEYGYGVRFFLSNEKEDFH